MKSNGKREKSFRQWADPSTSLGVNRGQAAIHGAACYFCRSEAVLEKGGRTVCSGCKDRLNGAEYPLRRPTMKPLYNQGEAARLRNQLTGE